MTAPTPPVTASPPAAAAPAVGTGTLHARVQRRVGGLAKQIVATLRAELPLYATLPREQLDGELTESCVEMLRVFLRTLRENREAYDAELQPAARSGARRAEERFPLEAVLASYHVAGRVGWQALQAEAGAGDQAELVEAAARLQRFVQRLSDVATRAYLAEQQHLYGEQRRAEEALVSATLAGQDTTALRRLTSTHPSGRYAVLVLAIAAHPDEQAAAVIGARRKVRRVQQVLNHSVGAEVLGLLQPDGGPVLVPLPDPAEPARPALHLPLSELATRLGAAAGVPVHVAAAETDRIEDPDSARTAAQLASDVLDVAKRLRRGPGLHVLDDVLLAFQLSRPSPAAERLRELVTPLERNPELILTLRTWLAHDLDRRATSAALHVHPNTLDGRLRRIVVLTGLDPATTEGLQLLAAGLTLHQLGRPGE